MVSPKMKNIKKKRIKIILLFSLFAFVVFFTLLTVSTATATSRPLEITYPKIPGITAVPTTISSGLPDYVKYVFNFSVVAIGIIILAVLVYSGVQYVYSAGNPAQLSDARKGVFYAILGALILLSSVILFNTINPELTTFKQIKISIIHPYISPGIYICDYDAGDVHGDITNYMSSDLTTSVAGAKKLRETMKNDKGSCYKIDSSKNLPFVFNKKKTFFEIPEKVFLPNGKSGTKVVWKYNYGLILHEKDNFKGECKLRYIYNTDGNGFEEPTDIGEGNFDAHSITIFKRVEEPANPSDKGVVLYNCLDYGNPDLCPPDVKGPGRASFSTNNNYRKVTEGELNNANMVASDKWKGARSIKFMPIEGLYLAIFFEKDNFKGNKCEVFSKKVPNILSPDHEIGRCGNSCWWYFSKETETKELKNCIPCLHSMVVIRGTAL